MSHQYRHARGVHLNSVDLFKTLQWLTRGADWSAVQMRGESSWTRVAQPLWWLGAVHRMLAPSAFDFI